RMSANAAFSASNGAYVESSNDVSGLLLGDWRTPATFNNLPILDPTTGEPRAFRFENPLPNTDFLSRVYDNPFFVAYNQKNTANVARTFGNVAADYQPVSWLHFNEQVGADYSNDERLFSEPWSSGGSAGLGSAGNVALGLVTQGFVKNWSIDQRLSGTAKHTFSDNFDATLTLGNNINVKQYNTSATTGYGLTTPSPFVLSNTTLIQPPNVYTSNVRLASFFGQLQGTLWHQLTLTTGLTDDGASTFGANKQFSLFPRGGASWNVLRDGDNNGAVKNILTSAKLRVSYGETGTQPRPYVLGSTYAAQTFADGFATGIPTSNVNGNGGLATNALAPNPDLTSERQKELELGTDIAFLHSFGDISFTYYREYTSGAIFAVPVSPFTGYTQEFENAADLWNRGF